MNKGTFRFALVAAVVLVAVAAVAAIAQEGGPEPFSAHTPPATADTDVMQSLSVFQRARTADDALPAAAVKNLDAVNTTGANAGLSRRALMSGDDTLYLLPADGKVCASLVAPDGTAWTGCNYAGAVASGENGPGVAIEGNDVTIMGIVPDSVSSVSVVLGDGTQKALKIQQNAYIARLDASQNVKSVAYTTPDGRTEFPLTVPDLDAITKREHAASSAR